jgi:hypothetical protein
VTSRDERVAANEAKFREANELIRDRVARLALDDGTPVPFVCECADTGCTDVIRLTLRDYEAVRASPHTFAIVPGHEATASETLVEGVGSGSSEFAVVEKKPPGQEITEQTDPRR